MFPDEPRVDERIVALPNVIAQPHIGSATIEGREQAGEKVIAISDNHGYVLSPLTIAPVNQSDIVLLPDGIKDLKHVAAEAKMPRERQFYG